MASARWKAHAKNIFDAPQPTVPMRVILWALRSGAHLACTHPPLHNGVLQFLGEHWSMTAHRPRHCVRAPTIRDRSQDEAVACRGPRQAGFYSNSAPQPVMRRGRYRRSLSHAAVQSEVPSHILNAESRSLSVQPSFQHIHDTRYVLLKSPVTDRRRLLPGERSAGYQPRVPVSLVRTAYLTLRSITTIVVGITCVLVSLGYAGYQVSYVVMMSNDSIMTSYYGIGGPSATPYFAKVLPFAIGIIEACLCLLVLAPIGAWGTVFAIKVS